MLTAEQFVQLQSGLEIDPESALYKLQDDFEAEDFRSIEMLVNEDGAAMIALRLLYDLMSPSEQRKIPAHLRPVRHFPAEAEGSDHVLSRLATGDLRDAAPVAAGSKDQNKEGGCLKYGCMALTAILILLFAWGVGLVVVGQIGL